VSSHKSLVRPPFLAVWLLELFAPDESILGDLLEEFATLAETSGVAPARQWYWRQSVKSVVRLIGTGFRTEPWLSIVAVLGGLLLLRFGFGLSLPERLIEGSIRLYEHHVTPYRTPAQWYAYVQRLNTAILIGQLLESLVVGCLVASAAKGREVIVTLTLGSASLVLMMAQSWMVLAMHRPGSGGVSVLPRVIFLCLCNAIMIVIGGIIVRERRLTLFRRSSSQAA
jgi:hypothetical protein